MRNDSKSCIPFCFTGTIDKVNYKLGPEQLSAEDKEAAAVKLASAKGISLGVRI